MIAASVIYGLITGLNLSFFSMEVFASLNSFALIAIPMFMLTAQVMNYSTVADRLFNFANKLIGWIPGGLGHTNVLLSVIFSGMSGSAAADASGMGFLAYKAMADKGFDKNLSAAVTAASACITPVTPPSIPMVVFAMVVSGTSVARLLMGGLIPGLLMAISMMVYISWISVKRGYPIEKKPNFMELLVAIRKGILPVLTPVLLLSLIVSGIVTVSEGAVFTVLYAIFLGVLVYRALSLKDFLLCLQKVLGNCGLILIFFGGGKMFSHILAKENIPVLFAEGLFQFTTNPLLLMLLVNVFFLVIGLLSDPLVSITLFAPIVIPIAHYVGMDVNTFGVIIVYNTMIGLITPPVGSMVFIISGLSKQPVHGVFRAVLPFVIGYIILLVMLSIFPQIISFLPNLLMG